MTIISYPNGNCEVTIDTADGTKTREWEGEPHPVLPESIDLKITNYCEMGCDYCHEASSPKGRHGATDWILYALGGLPKGVEVAIGGGNPLRHPGLPVILRGIYDMGLIANMTVHGESLRTGIGWNQLSAYGYKGWLHGLGISLGWGEPTVPPPPDLSPVYHAIIGVTGLAFVDHHVTLGRDVLILGFKAMGRGRDWDERLLEPQVSNWRQALPDIIASAKGRICFDNLALEQLHVRELVSPDVWKTFYMGDDGQFTMFIDAVEKTYAASSLDQRKPMGPMVAREAFIEIQTDTNQ